MRKTLIKRVLRGRIEAMYSPVEKGITCSCCPGDRHAFARFIQIDGGDGKVESAVTAAVWSHARVGKRVRITIEVLG